MSIINNLVSIITPSYRSKKFIKETIDSVKSQTYNDWEMIIVDDCSPDNSAAYIETLIKDDERIKLIILDKNVGAAEARNKALGLAKGRYIAFLDSDDIWYPNKLELQLEFMKSGNYPISFTAYEIIDDYDHPNGSIVNVVNSLTMSDYAKNTIIGFSTSMLDRKLIKSEIKLDNTVCKVCEDAALWLRLLGNGNIAYGLNMVLGKYRVHNNSISSNKFKSIFHIWNLYYRVFKFGLFKATYYFGCYVFNAIKKRM